MLCGTEILLHRNNPKVPFLLSSSGALGGLSLTKTKTTIQEGA